MAAGRETTAHRGLYRHPRLSLVAVVEDNSHGALEPVAGGEALRREVGSLARSVRLQGGAGRGQPNEGGWARAPWALGAGRCLQDGASCEGLASSAPCPLALIGASPLLWYSRYTYLWLPTGGEGPM